MASEIDWLIAGLGNRGEEYENTPHNLGFMVVDKLAARHSIGVTRKECVSYVGLGRIKGIAVALAKPQMYMNLSGPPVRDLLDKYGLASDRLVLVYDELALPWQQIRIRPRGSDAGHNGVKSVIGTLGTGEFIRVRLGINPAGRPVGDGAKFVLGQFKRAQKQEVEEVVELGASAVESIIADGVEKSMTAFNRSVAPEA